MSEEHDAWVLRVLGFDVSQARGEDLAEPVGLVQFAKLRLQWQDAKKSVAGELSQLRSTVQTEMADDPMLANLSRLSQVLGAFNEGLSDLLDDLANADAPEKRRAAAEAAEAAADRYIDHIVEDGLIEHVETNPFMDVQISAHLLPPLSAIQQALGSIRGSLS